MNRFNFVIILTKKINRVLNNTNLTVDVQKIKTHHGRYWIIFNNTNNIGVIHIYLMYDDIKQLCTIISADNTKTFDQSIQEDCDIDTVAEYVYTEYISTSRELDTTPKLVDITFKGLTHNQATKITAYVDQLTCD